MWQSVIMRSLRAAFYQPGVLSRWTGHKRGPVNALLEGFVRLKGSFEVEGELGRPVFFQVGQALRRFIKPRAMPRRMDSERAAGTTMLWNQPLA